MANRRASMLKEPLLHFLAGGLALFAIHAWVGKPDEADGAIEVTAAEVERLRALWTEQSGRPPSAEKLRALVDAEVREEILYREAKRLGLGQHDVMVRRRLAQKLEFMMRDVGGPMTPDNEELAVFLAENAERYLRPERLSFRHVFFDADLRPAVAADAKKRLAELRSERPAFGTTEIHGDPSMLASAWSDQTLEDVSRHFGQEFAEALFAVEDGLWQGPIESSIGTHLVRIEHRQPSRPAALEEVRAALVRDWSRVRQQDWDAAAYERLRARYDVDIPDLSPRVAAADSEPRVSG